MTEKEKYYEWLDHAKKNGLVAVNAFFTDDARNSSDEELYAQINAMNNESLQDDPALFTDLRHENI